MNLHGMNRSAEPKNLYYTLMMKVVQPKIRWKVCVCVWKMSFKVTSSLVMVMLLVRFALSAMPNQQLAAQYTYILWNPANNENQ
jgi:hypothetical protein